MDNERVDAFIRAMGWIPTDQLRDQVRRGMAAVGVQPAPVGVEWLSELSDDELRIIFYADPKLVTRLKAALAPQPPAEAQAQGGGELWHMVAKLAAHVRPTCGELWAEAERLLNRTAPPSAPVGVEGWRVEPVEDDPDMLAVETPDGRTWFAKRGDRVFELAEALALAQQPAADSPSFTAGDMTDAAAQGFRDGVASVGTVGVGP